MLKCGRGIFFILFLLVTLYVTNTAGLSKFLPWPNAEEIIQLMCPSSKICDIEKTIIGPSNPCCTECFCGDDCVDGYECCFRENEKTEYETCLYLRSMFNNFFAFIRLEYSSFSYYVVTKAPNNGCLGNKGSCDSSDTSTIYPVYSEITRKIYFNKACATCHGISKVLDPEIYFFCDGLGRSESLNFEEELSKFLEGDSSTQCYLTYSFPSVSTGHRKCSIHAVESIENLINITNEDHIRNHYNMSIEDIAEACRSSFFSPTLSASKGKLYPNPFCYLYGEGTHEKDRCFQSNGNPSGVQFVALLNPKIKTILPLQSSRKTRNLDQVCLKISPSSSNQNVLCRPLACPIGHIFSTNGSCIFFGQVIFKDGRMNLFLNVILRSLSNFNIKNGNLLNMSLEDVTNGLQVPGDWKIVFWGKSVDVPPGKRQDRYEIILILQLVDRDLAQGIESILSYLNKEVLILNDTYIPEIYAKKLTLEDILPRDVIATTICSSAKNIRGITNVEDDAPDCWEVIGSGVNPSFAVSVESLTKLYFCQVVELTSSEFILLANGTLLFNEICSKYLHENEFLVQNDENNKLIAKVCLEDSGLSRPNINASFKDKDASFLSIVFVLILSVSLIT